VFKELTSAQYEVTLDTITRNLLMKSYIFWDTYRQLKVNRCSEEYIASIFRVEASGKLEDGGDISL
jgi:hypothetical protein